MATSPELLALVDEQLAGLPVRTAPMFGGHGLWCDDKPLGVITRTLYLKRSDTDPALLEGTELAPAYDGAKRRTRTVTVARDEVTGVDEP